MKLSWDQHALELMTKIKPQVRALLRGTRFMDLESRKIMYNAVIASRLNYGDVIWNTCGPGATNKLQTIQNMIARRFLHIDYTKTREALKTLKWLTLKGKREVHTAVQDSPWRVSCNYTK